MHFYIASKTQTTTSLHTFKTFPNKYGAHNNPPKNKPLPHIQQPY